MSEPLDLGAVKTTVQALGFRLVRAESGPMDSGTAEFSDGSRAVTINKDRGQWMLAGPRLLLEPFGLWRAFDHTKEFCDAISHYLQQTRG